MHRTTRRLVTGTAAVSAGLLLVAPITALAQTDQGSTTTTTAPAPTPTTSGSTPSATPPKDAMTWITNVLDNLVKAGTITQAQEDAITKALAAARPTFDHGPGGPGGRFDRFGFGVGLDAAAKALGITVDELRTELQTKTLAQIAADHKIDVQQVIDALTAAAKTKLDDAVKAGRLTQAEADSRLKDLTDRITSMVNQKLPMPGERGGGWPGHHRDDEGAGSTTTTSPGGS